MWCSSFHQTSGSSEWNSEGPGEDFPLWDGCWNEWQSVGESKDRSADADSGQSSGDMWEHDLSTETDTFQESGRRLPLEDNWNFTFPRIHVVMTCLKYRFFSVWNHSVFPVLETKQVTLDIGVFSLSVRHKREVIISLKYIFAFISENKFLYR